MPKLLKENVYLEDMWKEQHRYNRKIHEETDIYDREHWTQIYLLGIVSEIDEILSDIQWKRHRKKQGRKIDKRNLAYELADLTKYVISLWDLWDFTAYEMLQYVEIKSKILELKYQQEFAVIPKDKPVLICDLDGTIADWRSSFIDWARDLNKIPLPIKTDSGSTLILDHDLSMRYPDYYALKEQFESEGGYKNIEPYWDGLVTLSKMKEDLDAYIIVITARPADVYHRIWMDTWYWFEYYNINVDQLRIGSNSRVLLADTLPNAIMFEDDPGLALRAANSGIKVFMRRQPYNESISHRNIRTVERYTELSPEQYFE